MSAIRYGHVLFHTSAAAFRAEKLALGAGLAGARLVPTPRELSSDCGVSLRFDPVALGAMERLLLESSVPYERIVAEQAPEPHNPGL